MNFKELRENKNSEILYENYISYTKDGFIVLDSYDYNGILSKLIVEAGKHCEYHAADLFIDWNGLLNKIRNTKETTHFEEWFGFRDFGVDHKKFMDAREVNLYSAIYKLVVDINMEKLTMFMSLVQMYKGSIEQ